ncbi:unnamed protein product [Colias eurytheme]|nr:unnamed protein product [Colias eurytheme]
MRFATWNVRTMRTGFPNTSESSNCAQDLRKTAVIDKELHDLNISIAGLQETRLPDEGSIRERHYTFFWKGRNPSQPSCYGVGFAVRNDLLCATESPEGISERLMSVRLHSKCGPITILSVYAPTLSSQPETKDNFYSGLSEVLRKIPSTERVVILGDFNARVGSDHTIWSSCLGREGVGRMNENGQRLLEFCMQYQLCITNTYFKGKSMHKVSWKHPRSASSLCSLYVKSQRTSYNHLALHSTPVAI